ncbi:haloacid dehalogenase [Sistotremastrum suecicum HHB10207 ss-3]|uniref:Haloacid dehalogenase n=1 Tax=Sistotremastrum suecicum HHB10207 ss-3 TaxID=1314776 RepID=A0A166F620_9AGAM|nr:haloacid dehalogenase [Sistotremastrum suecicum HHB10207 ss-3]
MSSAGPLEGVEALLFDVFGTVVNWEHSITRELQAKSKGVDIDWNAFAKEWRKGYMITTRSVAAGGEGPSNVDVMHREILDRLLTETKWSAISNIWNEDEKKDLVLAWHRLSGWPDTTEGLYALKKQLIICTLSNGNVRLLADMAKNADLPWDVIFSGELLGSYKPPRNPKTYLGAAYHLTLPPNKVAMVAAHYLDLKAAASFGLKTVYVRRPTEDTVEERTGTKTKKEGGDVDVVVDSFTELAEVLPKARSLA